MTRRWRVIAIAAVGAVGAIAAAGAGARTRSVDLTALGAGLVVGYLIELRPFDRSPLPVAFAITLVLLRATTATEFVLVVCAGAALGSLLSDAPRGWTERTLKLAERLAEGLGAGAMYRLVTEIARSGDPRVSVISALAAAAVVQVAVTDAVSASRGEPVASLRSRGADLAVLTSGMLMAVGYGGIANQGGLGLWGPLLFSIPLIAAWYSFELLNRSRRTFRQTVQALGVAPELGGLARSGHVARVAALSVAVGNELGLSADELDDLETAAWLHHLGSVCLEEPPTPERANAAAVAAAGAEMLRSSKALSRAGDIVAAEPTLNRPPSESSVSVSPGSLLGQVLKVASAYDELTEGSDSHAAWAVDALFTGPAYVYDGRVLSALEKVLSSRGLLKN